MKKYLLAVNLCVLLLAGCKKDVPYLADDNEFLTFQIAASPNAKQVTSDLNFAIYDTLVVGVTGNTNGRSALVASFTTMGTAVSVDGVLQVSGETVNDFTKPVVYTITAQNGSQRRYTVKLKAFTGLPILYLTTAGPVESKDDYVTGTFKVDGNLDFTEGLYDGVMEIRGRGNTTWNMPKKPYKIKLDSKSKILGMPSDKEWALLANYYDKALLRNDVAFELSERIGLAWTPKRKFVDVFINGSYNGNYLLTETVKSNKDRVDIDTKNGGYLIEFNSKPEEGDPRFYTGSGGNFLPVDIKEGEVSPALIKSEIDSFYYKIENYQFDPVTGYQKQFDLDAFVSWYLVNEIMINNDAVFFSSVFLQKKNAASKIKMGPVWDFDLSSGNVSYGHISPEGWYLKTGNVIQFIWNDPYFQQAVKVKWNKYRSQILSIVSYVNSKENYIKRSATENYQQWDVLATPLSTSVVTPGTYSGEVDYFRNWLTARVAWMDAEINK